jgi:hypothetical protein
MHLLFGADEHNGICARMIYANTLHIFDHFDTILEATNARPVHHRESSGWKTGADARTA